MRSHFIPVTALVLIGCGAQSATEMFEEPASAAGAPAFGGDEAPGDETPIEGAAELGPAAQLAPGQGALVGVTKGGMAIFREGSSLLAVDTSEGAAAETIAEQAGTVLIRGDVVFTWTDVDWMLGTGNLSVWTAAGGLRAIGMTALAEGLIAASEDGSTIVFTANEQDGMTDLMLAPSDMSATQVLIAGMGLGSEETCGASLGFVGERLFVGSCEVGSRAATIRRYEPGAENWEATIIAEDALPAWSADSSGEQVFYQSSQYGALVAVEGEHVSIDTGVSRGSILPDGSAVLYTVGDQLRRTALPEVSPVPIVTTGYSQPVEFSGDFELALYSTTVTYEQGTQRDLRLVTTHGFNAAPIELVSEPIATLARSSISRDGRFVFYLTDVSPTGATLHVVEADGTQVLEIPNVTEAVAAFESTLVFSDNASDPDLYPIVADLKVIDLALETEPRVIEEKILGPRNFYLDPEGEKVIYVRSGIERDAAAAERDGVFFRALR